MSSSVRKMLSRVGFASFMWACAIAPSHAGIIGYIEEINGGADLRLTVSGYVDTDSLGSFIQAGNTEALLYGQGAWAYMTHDRIDHGYSNHYTTTVTNSFTGGGLTSLRADGGTNVTGGDLYFAANSNANIVWIDDDYVSGTLVHHVIEYAGINYATGSVTLGDSVTKSWNGGGAGNFISIVAGAAVGVPESSTLGILSLSVVLMGLVRRRRPAAA